MKKTAFRQDWEADRLHFHEKWAHRMEGFTAGTAISALFYLAGLWLGVTL